MHSCPQIQKGVNGACADDTKVHNDEDGGKSIRGGELLDEVHGNRVPWASRDRELFK